MIRWQIVRGPNTVSHRPRYLIAFPKVPAVLTVLRELGLLIPNHLALGVYTCPYHKPHTQYPSLEKTCSWDSMMTNWGC